MDKYYLTLDHSKIQRDPTTSQGASQGASQPIKHSPKQLTAIKSSEINKSPSPKTLKKNISNENFIKFQWAWIL